jgi:ubiquinone/menaquinone biosynthesis C-methylase UbiE
MSSKEFYEQHKNFSLRKLSEYNISPGIRCKFDLILKNLGTNRSYNNALEIGCSGDSFLYIYNNIMHKSFMDIATTPLKQYTIGQKNFEKKLDFKMHPLCADTVQLPYQEKQFDLIIALDVLEHIKKDKNAVKEISRVIKPNGIVLITVPHQKKFYTMQDKIIGHYRRYEINELKGIFGAFGLKEIRIFGIYGKLMQISEIQTINPDKTEKFLIQLREKYENNLIFRKFWKIFVKFCSIMMKLDATYRPLSSVMNIALIFQKKY